MRFVKPERGHLLVFCAVLWLVCAASSALDQLGSLGSGRELEKVPAKPAGRVLDLGHVLEPAVVGQLEEAARDSAFTVVTIRSISQYHDPSIEALAGRWWLNTPAGFKAGIGAIFGFFGYVALALISPVLLLFLMIASPGSGSGSSSGRGGSDWSSDSGSSSSDYSGSYDSGGSSSYDSGGGGSYDSGSTGSW